MRNSVFGGAGVKSAGVYAGGSFWKRFDRVESGAATGHVVNYELEFIPGKPEVREVAYPDGSRAYFSQGDRVLLLRYTNEPYRIVYDTIKIIDDDSAIGVMHLGDFPNGLEFATFVMERHNYPFEKMSAEDHRLIFADPRAAIPAPGDLEGEWGGHLVLLARPATSLLNQANPVAFRVRFEREAGGAVRPHCRFRADGEDFAGFQHEIRKIDENMLIGKAAAQGLEAALLRGLQDCIEPAAGRFVFYNVLTRE